MKRHLALAACLVLTVVCWTPVMAQEVPFTGEVIQDGVQARCGAGNRYYVVGTLPKGTRVTVDEIFYGWNKIVPPPGVYSYISKAFVDAKGDGKTGEVKEDGQDVKAASLQSPGESWRVQTTLNKGAVVQIVGEEGSFYKIIPPKDAYVYLPPGSVSRIEGTAVPPAPKPEPEAKPETRPAPAPVVEEEKPAPAPVAETPVAETPAVETPATPETPETPVAEAPAETPVATETPAVEEMPIPMEKGGDGIDMTITDTSFAAVEEKMRPLLNKPVLEQPIDEMIAAYESVDATNLSPQEQQVLALRLRALKDNKKLADTLRHIQQVQKEVDEGIVAQEIEAQRQKVLSLSDYDVTGTLSVSAVYSGETLPRLYRIVSGEGRTLAWVLPKPPVDARQHIGKLVGILGDKQYDDALKLSVYVVDRIDILTPKAPPEIAPAPAEPAAPPEASEATPEATPEPAPEAAPASE